MRNLLKNLVVAVGIASCTNPKEITNIQETKNELIVTLNSGEKFSYKVNSTNENCISWTRDAGSQLIITQINYQHTNDRSPIYEGHSCLTDKDTLAQMLYEKAIKTNQ